MSDRSSKTEQPTAKRLKEAREKGQIPRTIELSSAAALVAGSYLLPWVVRTTYRRLVAMWAEMEGVIAGTGMRGTAVREGEPIIAFVGRAMGDILTSLLPLLAVLVVLGVGTSLAQTGWVLSTKKLKPDVKKLNPLKGLKNLLSPNSLVELVKNVAKIAVISLLAWPACRELTESLLALGRPPVVTMARLTADAGIGVVRAVGWVTFVIAAGDYAWQRKRTMDQLKMSKQEVKDEHKQQEGDPKLKGQIRQRMFAMTRNRMMAAVPDADVVIVNPTHLSVALRYDAASGAPKVLAKGSGAVALRIREIAAEHHLPIVHDKPLARTLYRLVEVEEAIPAALYEAVARVLAFVFTLRSKGQADGWHESPFAHTHEALTELPDRAPAPAGAGSN